jgi:hypothetical protein
MRAIEPVSFASSDFKLRTCAPLFFSAQAIFLEAKTSNVAHYLYLMCSASHFDSLNLVRNSNLEFEFMHKIQEATEERAQLERPGTILGFYQLDLGRTESSSSSLR